MNEAGLCISEMTLRGTRYPGRAVPHPSVPPRLGAVPARQLRNRAGGDRQPRERRARGHCQWHFFVSDRDGRAAVIEFLDGKTVVRTGDALPWKLLTNSTYEGRPVAARRVRGFGGSRRLEPAPDCRPDLRFVTAAGMIRDIQADPAGPTVEQAFSVLQAMWCGVNRFSLVYDPVAMRMYFTTYRGRSLRLGGLRVVRFRTADRPCRAWTSTVTWPATRPVRSYRSPTRLNRDPAEVVLQGHRRGVLGQPRLEAHDGEEPPGLAEDGRLREVNQLSGRERDIKRAGASA